jgi:hypothetical protein
MKRSISWSLLAAAVTLVVTPASSPARSGGPQDAIRFQDVTDSVNLNLDPSRMWGSAWGDYNADGDLDLFVGRHLSLPRLFENRGGTFAPAPDEEDLFERFDRHQCAWGEANGDGRIDLYCTAGAVRGTGATPNRLYIQTDSGWVDRAKELGVTSGRGRGRTVNWIDLDADSDLDLFIGNKRRRHFPNLTLLNTGTRFERVHLGLNQRVSTIGSSWADWDRDGDPDLIVFQYKDGHPVVYENRGGRFARTRVPVLQRYSWRSGAWGDYNGDGWPDLHLVSERRSLILRNRRGDFKPVHSSRLRQGRMSTWLDVDNDGDLDSFIVQGAAPNGRNRADVLIKHGRRGFVKLHGDSFRGPISGDGDSVSSGDFDLDGGVDLYVTNGFGEGRGTGVLLKNTTPSGNWSILNLRGSGNNPLGFGAKIRVVSESETYRRQVTDGVNYRSQSATGQVHLGLGRAPEARVTIRWADGTKDCVAASHSDVLTIDKGAHTCG